MHQDAQGQLAAPAQFLKGGQRLLALAVVDAGQADAVGVGDPLPAGGDHLLRSARGRRRHQADRRFPAGCPSARLMHRAGCGRPAGSGVSCGDPASSMALLLTQHEWPSLDESTTGWSGRRGPGPAVWERAVAPQVAVPAAARIHVPGSDAATRSATRAAPLPGWGLPGGRPAQPQAIRRQSAGVRRSSQASLCGHARLDPLQDAHGDAIASGVQQASDAVFAIATATATMWLSMDVRSRRYAVSWSAVHGPP